MLAAFKVRGLCLASLCVVLSTLPCALVPPRCTVPNLHSARPNTLTAPCHVGSSVQEQRAAAAMDGVPKRLEAAGSATCFVSTARTADQCVRTDDAAVHA